MNRISILMGLVFLFLGCKQEEPLPKVESKSCNQGGLIGYYLSWSHPYQEEYEISLNNEKKVSKETYNLYFLPEDKAIAKIKQERGMTSDFLFLTAKWEKLGGDSIRVKIDKLPDFSISFCRDQNLGRVSNQLVEIKQSSFTLKKSGELTKEWFLAKGKWKELKSDEKDEWLEIAIDLTDKQSMVSVKWNDLAEQVLYYLPDTGLTYLEQGNVINILFGAESLEEEISEMFLSYTDKEIGPRNLMLIRD